MNHEADFKTLLENINREVVKEFIKVPFIRDKSIIKSKFTNIIFPEYSKDDGMKNNFGNRFSEQELSYLFKKVLDIQENIFYSIETPTLDSTKNRFDICIYNTNCEKKAIIELKGINPQSINKDFNKLLRDETPFVNFFLVDLNYNGNLTGEELQNTLFRKNCFLNLEKFINDELINRGLKDALCCKELLFSILFYACNNRTSDFKRFSGHYLCLQWYNFKDTFTLNNGNWEIYKF